MYNVLFLRDGSSKQTNYGGGEVIIQNNKQLIRITIIHEHRSRL